MRKLFTSVKGLLVALMVLPATLAMTQYSGAYEMASFGYTYGITPQNTSVSDATDAYEYWKDNFVTSSQACGYQRVIFDYYSGGLGKTDQSQTVSEGIAYGMLLAAYRGDKDLFDDLWGYYQSKENGNGVMNWKIENCGVIGYNGASDAELDVAMSLIIASEQWQTDSYLNDAKDLIRIIREKEFDGFVLKPGDQFGGTSLTNASYNSPAYYRVFKDYDGNESFWESAASQGYVTIAGSPGADDGLVPDWSTSAGGYSSGASAYTDQGKSFFFDAVRTPFRSAIDYLWHESSDALAYLNKFNSWAMRTHNNNIANTGSKYDMSGNKTDSYHNATFASCFAVAAMAGGTATQAYLNTGYNDVKNNGVGYGEYFNATFKAIGLFVMTGNFYLPKQCDNKPNLGLDLSLCSSNSVSVSTAAVSGASYSWKKDGESISGSSNSISASSAGEYEVTMISDDCAARDKVIVYSDELEADFIAVAGAGTLTLTDNTVGGVSNYSYEITDPSDNISIETTQDVSISSASNGLYSITLTVDNNGFGCADQSSVTKTVAVGDGTGVAIDDFSVGNNDANYAYVSSAKIDAIEKTWCSSSDYPSGSKECPVFDCGVWNLDFNSSAASQYDLFGISFEGTDAPYDLTDVPYVAIRAWATEDIDVYVKLNQKDGVVDFSNNSSSSNEIALTTEPQLFNLDYSALLSGWDNTQIDPDCINSAANNWGCKVVGSSNIDAWNSVTGISFFPFDNGTALINEDFEGTITIDYVIVGAKGLPAPSFNILKDDLGFTDYGVYLKDYYPNDPTYADCETDDESGLCYGSVPDWSKSEVICTNTATLESNSCTAEEVRWYKGSTFLGTGETYDVSSEGTYIVELINQGGVTRDTVEVAEGGNASADFDVEYDNSLGVNFYNESLDFNTWVWDFGNDENFQDEDAQTTVWDPAYYGYLAEGDYDVTLTVTDTICGSTDAVTKEITIVCNGPEDFTITTANTDDKLCSGDVVTYTMEVPAYTADHVWYLPLNTTAVYNEDSTSVEVTFDDNSSGSVKVEAYGGCLAKQSSDSIVVQVDDAVTASFVVDSVVNSTVYATSTSSFAEEIEWTLGVVSYETAELVHTYDESGEFEVCFEARNLTCNTTDQDCQDVMVTVVGLANDKDFSAQYVAFPNPSNAGVVQFSKTITNVVVTDMLGNELKSEESVEKLDVSDLTSGVYFVKSTEGTVRLIVE